MSRSKISSEGKTCEYKHVFIFTFEKKTILKLQSFVTPDTIITTSKTFSPFKFVVREQYHLTDYLGEMVVLQRRHWADF